VGSVGSKKGYSTVIIRSKVGEELLKNLVAAKKNVDREEVVRQSKFKMERAKRSLVTLNNPK
jgi:coenzyme F420-reducing hydrogenase beta subunit